MCVKNTYNKIIEHGTLMELNKFMDSCESCVKYGSCDYLGWVEDKLVEKESSLTQATK